MSYTPTEWKDGDIITAEKLNKIENGIVNGNGTKMVELHYYAGGEEPEPYAMGYLEDITFEEIQTLIRSGVQVCFIYEYDNGGDLYTTLFTLSFLEIRESGERRYEVGFSTGNYNLNLMSFYAYTPDGTLITYHDG